MSKHRGAVQCLLIIVVIKAYSYTGVTSLEVLNLEIGARQIGLAGTYVSVIGDIEGVHYNPSGLRGLDKQVSMMYSKSFADMGYGSVLYGKGNLAFGLVYFNGGEIELNYSDKPSEIKKAQQDVVLIFGLGKTIWNLGMNFKYIHSILVEEVNMQALVLDIGKIYDIRMFGKETNIGWVIKNLGYGITRGGKSSGKGILPLYIPSTDIIPRYYAYDYLPLGIKTGLSTIIKDKWLILTNLIYDVNNYMLYNGIGCEYKHNEKISFRCGTKYGYKTFIFTGGIGFRVNKYEFDYSFNYNYNLGLTHYMSLGMKW